MQTQMKSLRSKDESFRLNDAPEQQVQGETEALGQANQRLLLELADRRKAEMALRDSERQLRAMFDNALDGMILLDDDRRILDANKSALQLLGYGIAEMRLLPWDALMPPQQARGVEERWKSFFEEGAKRGEIELRRSCGSPRFVSYSARANIQPGRHLMTFRDLTDQGEVEDSLRLLSQRLMQLQDEERRRIARELHDSTGQCLAALGMHLGVIAAESHALPQKARKSVAEAVEICQHCSADIRTISYLLHPPLLDDVGLLPALEWYISGFSERSGVEVTKEICKLSKPLPRDLNTTLFRIIQEALVNIHKHADSKTAKIRLNGEDGIIVLEISDSGNGIDPARLRNGRIGARGLGVGITGMRERVRQLGGTLEIEPANPGTLIRATFPIMEENDNGNI